MNGYTPKNVKYNYTTSGKRDAIPNEQCDEDIRILASQTCILMNRFNKTPLLDI